MQKQAMSLFLLKNARGPNDSDVRMHARRLIFQYNHVDLRSDLKANLL